MIGHDHWPFKTRLQRRWSPHPSYKREAHRQVLCPKTLSCPEIQRERGREREKLENQPFPFQNENQDLSNCLFWYYLKGPSKSPTICGCRNMLVCRRNTVKHRRRHLCWKKKWKRSSEKKVLSLWNFEIFYSNNVIIYSRCSKLIHSPLSLTWMFY